MAEFNPIDHSKLHFKFLGWGVDRRKRKEEWMESLKCYDGYQIRELDENNRNINIIPCSEFMSIEEICTDNVHGKLHGEIGGGDPTKTFNATFKIGFVAKKASECTKKVEYEVTETATLQGDIVRDPGAIRVRNTDGSETHYSKFEESLSRHILEHVKMRQREFSSQVRGHLGIPVKDLPGDNSIARLQHFTKGNEIHLWELVADGCTKYVEKIQSTHYVYSITLGRGRTEKNNSTHVGSEIPEEGTDATSTDSEIKVDGTTNYITNVKGEVKMKYKYSKHRENRMVHELGNESSDPEVIQAKAKPLSSLISEKSPVLKLIMDRLLESCGEIMQGYKTGPYKISFHLSQESRDFYWQAVEHNIYGTEDVEQASEFYIKYIRKQSPEFCIIHNSHGYERFVSCKDGLKLGRTAEVTNISFVLENSVHRAVDLPLAPRSWTREGPFFIKVPSEGWLQWILKIIGYFSESYIVMSKCDEPSKPQYKAVTEKNIENVDLMLFTINCQLIDNNELLRKQPATDNNELLRKQPAIAKPLPVSHPYLAGIIAIIIGATPVTPYHYPNFLASSSTLTSPIVAASMTSYHYPLTVSTALEHAGSSGKREYRRRLP